MSKPEVDSSDIEKIVSQIAWEAGNKGWTRQNDSSQTYKKYVSQLEAMMVKERIDEAQRARLQWGHPLHATDYEMRLAYEAAKDAHNRGVATRIEELETELAKLKGGNI